MNLVYDTLLLKHQNEAIKLAKLCNINKEAYHGGSFNGNACRMLLKKIDILASCCPLNCLKYVHVLRDFDNVVNSCFGKKLDLQYQN